MSRISYGADWPRIDGRPVLPNTDIRDENVLWLARQQIRMEKELKDRQQSVFMNANLGTLLPPHPLLLLLCCYLTHTCSLSAHIIDCFWMVVNDVGGITFCAGGIPALLRYNTAPLIAGTVGGVAYGLSAAALGFGYDKIGYASGIGISLGVAGVSATRAFTTKRPFPTLFLSGWFAL
jgi:hypothetical protein